jgi:RHS repeat-associated protein
VEQLIDYNRQGGIKRNTYIVNEHEMLYDYDHCNTPEQKLVTVKLPCRTKQTIEFDGLGRTTSINTGKLSKDIYYKKISDHATPYVNSVWHGKDGIQQDNTRYSYDKNGNITKITENGREAVRYTYDSLNRLTREENQQLNKTTAIEYDNNGNILAKTVNGNRATYTYSKNGWRDQLIILNKKDKDNNEIVYKFEYDAIGNPNKILRNNQPIQIAWERGRNLVTYNGHTFTYNAQGIRTSKTLSDGTKITYYLDGTRILLEEHTNTQGTITNELYYYYGIDGIAGFKHVPYGNGQQAQTYLYQKNIQGDIIGICDKNGTEIASYAYDAWGNPEVTYDTNGIAKLNPFRYRGYYYDVTTNLYYLQSRYYSPELSRFLNADCISELDPETLNGLNLYAYCGNNPITRIDSTGRFFTLIFGAIGGLVGGLVGGFRSLSSGQGFWSGAKMGALTGLAVGMSIGAITDGFIVTIGSGGLATALGAGLIGFGVASLLGGVTNMDRGGSFLAGWAGGGVTGFISAFSLSFGPIGAGIGGFVGNLVGNALTNYIDGRQTNWNSLVDQSLRIAAINIFAYGIGQYLPFLNQPGTRGLFVMATIAFEVFIADLSDRMSNPNRRRLANFFTNSPQYRNIF